MNTLETDLLPQGGAEARLMDPLVENLLIAEKTDESAGISPSDLLRPWGRGIGKSNQNPRTNLKNPEKW